MKINEQHPIAVFGTLRTLPEGQGNHHLMDGFIKRKIGFIPHLITTGIWTKLKPFSSMPVEIFWYDEKQYPITIKQIDTLEGFNPNNPNKLGYIRSLYDVHLLPDDYEHPLFETNIRNIPERDLEIDSKEWEKYQKVPCWVYTNQQVNYYNKLSRFSTNLIWEPLIGEI